MNFSSFKNQELLHVLYIIAATLVIIPLCILISNTTVRYMALVILNCVIKRYFEIYMNGLKSISCEISNRFDECTNDDTITYGDKVVRISDFHQSCLVKDNPFYINKKFKILFILSLILDSVIYVYMYLDIHSKGLINPYPFGIGVLNALMVLYLLSNIDSINRHRLEISDLYLRMLLFVEEYDNRERKVLNENK